jgi:hypothetical protein
MPLEGTDIPVRTDVFIHDLEPFTLGALRRALARGLMPMELDLVGDGIVILRFAQNTDPSEIVQSRGEGKITWRWSADTRCWLSSTGCERPIFFDANKGPLG